MKSNTLANKYLVLLAMCLAGSLLQGQVASGVDKEMPQPNSIQQDIKKAIERREPIDLSNLIRNIYDTPTNMPDMARDLLVRDLGALLLYEGNIHSKPEYLPGLRDPRVMLNTAVISAFSRLANDKHVEYLCQFYEAHGKEGYPDLPAVIAKLGGTVPAKVQGARPPGQQESGPSISEEERQSRRSEVQFLLQHIETDRMSNEQLAKVMSRIGEIGESQDAIPIIKKLADANVHWIVRQDAFQVLGQLGGPDAIDYLLKEIQKPVPKNANLDDYSDIHAILQSQAALALGKCGHVDVIGILKQVATDETQFKRVRESCNMSVAKIRDRFSSHRLSRPNPQENGKDDTQ